MIKIVKITILYVLLTFFWFGKTGRWQRNFFENIILVILQIYIVPSIMMNCCRSSNILTHFLECFLRKFLCFVSTWRHYLCNIKTFTFEQKLWIENFLSFLVELHRMFSFYRYQNNSSNCNAYLIKNVRIWLYWL